MRTSTLLSTATLLLPGALARVARGQADEPEPLAQRTRITAFVVRTDGSPSIQCWELPALSSSTSVRRKDGTSGSATYQRLGTAGDHDQSIESVGIDTWPANSRIYPPAKSKSSEVDASILLFLKPTYWNSKDGMTIVKSTTAKPKDDDDDEGDFVVFDGGNGDDWFYFEDLRATEAGVSGSDYLKIVAESTPFTIDSIGNRKAELIRIEHSSTPAHKVLHEGPCRYAGVTVPADDDTTGAGRLKLNLQIEEL